VRIEGDWRGWLGIHPQGPPLDEGLHRIARDEGATASLADVQAELDALAAGVDRDGTAEDRLASLVHHLFVAEGFAGDQATYDDPANSRIDQVLERRRGMPILLSAVAMEVGRRAGVPLAGVSFPGHFLVCTTDEPRVFLDPFHGGDTVARADLLEDLRRRYPRLDERQYGRALRPTPTVELLLRVSTNLVASWQRRGEPRAALRSAERRVALAPDRHDLLRDRAALRAEAGDHAGATFDLGAYLEHVGDTDPAEAAAVRWKLSMVAWAGLAPVDRDRLR
jgi:regulator of sirC expression with transglutaminase-like and TPR domain